MDMQANNDPKLDKENNQFMQQDSICRKFEVPANASGAATKSFCPFIPQLIIPQLKLPQRLIDAPNTAEAIAAQEEQHRAADAHNEMLLNEIKRRREQSDGNIISASSHQPIQLASITVPKLRSASGQPLDVPHFNIPLLNKLRSQNNSLEAAQALETSQALEASHALKVSQLERDVNTLKLTSNDNGTWQGRQKEQKAPLSPLIDLTTTIIAVHKDAVPREAASMRRNKMATVTEHFNIPFISCDIMRNRLSESREQAKKRQTGEAENAPAIQIVEKLSVVGKFMDESVGYPSPRQPQLKYAVTTLELRHLKMCKREDYGSNIKRFRFDTPSPDELVKAALKKSWRISRT